jgi:hypothetical protein
LNSSSVFSLWNLGTEAYVYSYTLLYTHNNNQGQDFIGGRTYLGSTLSTANEATLFQLPNGPYRIWASFCLANATTANSFVYVDYYLNHVKQNQQEIYQGYLLGNNYACT